MIEDEGAGEGEYFQRVLQQTLNGFVAAGAIEGSGGGMVDLDEAVKGALAAVAILVVQSGAVPTPRDRRQFAHECMQQLRKALEGAASSKAAGNLAAWQVSDLGQRH